LQNTEQKCPLKPLYWTIFVERYAKMSNRRDQSSLYWTISLIVESKLSNRTALLDNFYRKIRQSV
ncbi:hypothetical protein LIZ98_15280, partial [Caldibacillus sp. 210928-DFI.2.18]|uniref:hypothetical protein n=1 Tax=Caldibacillus sp. 210928-DFI.2.18 TaxID=2883264 RepID=UPI001D07A2F1